MVFVCFAHSGIQYITVFLFPVQIQTIPGSCQSVTQSGAGRENSMAALGLVLEFLRLKCKFNRKIKDIIFWNIFSFLQKA